MDSEKGGLSSTEKQRQAAAEIARRKVLQAYDKLESLEAGEEAREEKAAEEFVRRREAGVSERREVLGKSATPVLHTVSNEEWKRYHTAWQDYYQKYYSEYYMNAAKEYVAKVQTTMTAGAAMTPRAGERPTEMITSKAEELSEVTPALKKRDKQGQKSFKERISERAREQEKSSRRRVVWTPILMGVSVMLVILFLQYNRLIFAPIAAYVSPGEAPAGEISAVDPTVTLTKVSAENKLIIPKLNVDVPINFGVQLDDVMSSMNNGVTHYRIAGASAYPGEIGNFVITGHSAGDIYSSNPYKFIFSGLERLEEGDILYVHYNSVRYTYKMVGREVIEPTEVAKLIIETDKPMMTLVTCYPLGTSRYRLLIRAEQISPSYTDAVVADDGELPVSFEEDSLPQNEDTFFEKIKKWLLGQ
ncbi:class E sortase [Candidatus Saccharibacteria bacterium]|nr:class E sortase [Candidatus Saccharibacteria bacterium]